MALPDLLSANNLTTKSLILPGDTLTCLPAGGRRRPPTAPGPWPSGRRARAHREVRRLPAGHCGALQGDLGRPAGGQQDHRQERHHCPGGNSPLPANAVAPQAAIPPQPRQPPRGSSLTYTVQVRRLPRRHRLEVQGQAPRSARRQQAQAHQPDPAGHEAGAAGRRRRSRPSPPSPAAVIQSTLARRARSSPTPTHNSASRTASSLPAPTRSTAPVSSRRPTARSGSR